MRKSQVATALALAALSSSALPLARVYAEPVTEGCTPSAGSAINTLSMAELQIIITNIKNNSVYQAYSKVAGVKAKYQSIVETKADGTEISLAEQIDNAVSAAATAKNDADNTLRAAETSLNNKLTRTNEQIQDLSGNTEYSATNIEETLDDIAALPLRNLYLDIINATDFETMEAAVEALNSNFKGVGAFSEVIDWDIVKGATVKATKATLVGTSPNLTRYGKHAKLAEIEAKVAEVKDLRTKQSAAEDVLQAATSAKTAAYAEIDAALTEIETAANDNTAVSKFTSQMGVDTVANAAQNLIHNQNIQNFRSWQEFIANLDKSVADGGYIDASDPAGSLNSIKTALGALISSNEVTAAVEPTSVHKVCSVDGKVAIKGNLPQLKLAIEAKEVANYPAIVNGAEQVVYDIEVFYKGAPFTNWADNAPALGEGKGIYTVIVNIPEYMDGSKAKVYFVNVDGGNFERPARYDAANNTLSFDTNHFSRYAIVGPRVAATDPTTPENPGTQDPEQPGTPSTPTTPDQKPGTIVIVPSDNLPSANDTVKPAVDKGAPNTGVVAEADATATSSIVAAVVTALAAAGIAVSVKAKRCISRK